MPYERTPFSAPSLESRLENWGSWSRRQMIVYEQCESFEGNYRSPQRWDKPPVNPPERPEDRDAYDVSLACAALTVRDHLALKLGYVVGLTDDHIARILTKETRRRTRTADMMQVFGEAKANLEAMLRCGATIRRVRAVEKTRQALPKIVEQYD